MSAKITSFFTSKSVSSDRKSDLEEKSDAETRNEKRKLSSTSSLENELSPAVRQPRKKTNVLDQSEISETDKEKESGQNMESREICEVLTAIEKNYALLRQKKTSKNSVGNSKTELIY